MRRRTARPQFSSAEGLTLIELMIAMLVLGVIFSALGSVIISSLQAITLSEREVLATSLAQQAVEELQAVSWDAAGLYSDEVASAPADWNGGNVTSYDDNELVLLETPAAGERLAQVPNPQDPVPLNAVDYLVNRYVTWVDRTGDDVNETKRFTVVVSWVSPSGEPRSLTSVGERVPTQAESPATSLGTRVLAITGSPDPAVLDNETAQNTQTILVDVRLNQGVPSTPTPTLRFYSFDGTPVVGADNQYVERTVPMTGSVTGENGWPTRWVATLPVGEYQFANGSLDVLFTATDDAGTLIESFGSFRLMNGPVDGPAPTPLTVSDTGSIFPVPPTAAEPAEPLAEPLVKINSVIVAASSSPICVNSSTWKLTKDIDMTIQTEGLTDGTGNVTVTYPTWTKKKIESTKLVNDSAVTTDYVTYTLTIDQAAGDRMFMPGENITFTAKGTRPDGSNAQLESGPITVAAC